MECDGLPLFGSSVEGHKGSCLPHVHCVSFKTVVPCHEGMQMEGEEENGFLEGMGFMLPPPEPTKSTTTGKGTVTG